MLGKINKKKQEKNPLFLLERENKERQVHEVAKRKQYSIL